MFWQRGNMRIWQTRRLWFTVAPETKSSREHRSVIQRKHDGRLEIQKRNKEGNRGGSAKKGTHGTMEVLVKKSNTGNTRCSGKEVTTQDLANKD